VAIGGQLDPVGEAAAQIVHKRHGVLARTVTNMIGDNQLRVGIDGGPHPNIASAFRSGLRRRDILRLGMAERPNLVALDAAGLHVAHRLVVKREASFAGLFEQLRDRVDRHIGNAADRPHERPFAQHGEDLGALGERQLVHASFHNELMLASSAAGSDFFV